MAAKKKSSTSKLPGDRRLDPHKMPSKDDFVPGPMVTIPVRFPSRDRGKVFAGGIVVGTLMAAVVICGAYLTNRAVEFIDAADAQRASVALDGYTPDEYCTFERGTEYYEHILMLDYNLMVESMARRDTDPANVRLAQCEYWADFVNSRTDYKMTCE